MIPVFAFNLDSTSTHTFTTDPSAHNLGEVFNANLISITHLFRFCVKNICDLHRMLDVKTASTIATSIVHGKLDYCNSMFTTQINHPHAIQNAFTKLSNTITSLLSQNYSTGLKYLNDYSTKSYHLSKTHSNPPRLIFFSYSQSNHSP